VSIILNIPFILNPGALSEKLNIKPGSEYRLAFEELVDAVQEIGMPKALYKVAYIDEKGADTVTLEGVVFTSRALMKNLDGIQRVFAYVATCGAELDEIPIDPGDLLKQYWLHAIKLNLLEVAVEHLRVHIMDRYQISQLAAMNPGSGEALVWPIEQQAALFSLFGDVQALIGVKLTPSFLMMPNISSSGLLFPAETTYHNCQLCQREVCSSRRAPFDSLLWEQITQGSGS
jgi:hypothetical protein